METACFLAGLGSSVTVVVRSKILRSFDNQVVSQLENQLLEKENMRILNKSSVKNIEKLSNGQMNVTLNINGENEEIMQEVDCVVLAVGRELHPESFGLDLIKDVTINSKRYFFQQF